MSSIEEHEANSLEVLGRPWTEVHEWLDQYFEEIPGAAHRVVLHHRLGIEKGVELFGEDARQVLLLHLMDDFEFIPETPEEVARIMDDQELLSFGQIEVLKAILARAWPSREFSFEGLGG